VSAPAAGMGAPGAGPRISDLSRARDERGTVVDVEEVGGGIVELTVELPWLAATARAGEFAQLRCGDGLIPLLRRPMSVSSVRAGTASFVFERVGAGTRALASLRPGDHLDVLGPLGIGFALPAAGTRVLCVSGGLGCAPFPLAVSAALRAGAARVTVLNGAATASRLFPAARFAAPREVAGGPGATDADTGDPRVGVVEATDDGSRGHHGVITELVPAELARGDVGALWACGPNPMLAALASVVARAPGRPAICEVSLEAPMGCGFGTCLGCALPVRRDGAGAWGLCCREGPVMDIGSVDWEALRSLPPAHVA
jgi:dihydroorotate dehydrogenase electron transfer subunit